MQDMEYESKKSIANRSYLVKYASLVKERIRDQNVPLETRYYLQIVEMAKLEASPLKS